MSLLNKLANSLTPSLPIEMPAPAQPALSTHGAMAMPAVARPHMTTHGPLQGARRGAVTQQMAMPAAASASSHVVPNAFQKAGAVGGMATGKLKQDLATLRAGGTPEPPPQAIPAVAENLLKQAAGGALARYVGPLVKQISDTGRRAWGHSRDALQGTSGSLWNQIVGAKEDMLNAAGLRNRLIAGLRQSREDIAGHLSARDRAATKTLNSMTLEHAPRHGGDPVKAEAYLRDLRASGRPQLDDKAIELGGMPTMWTNRRAIQGLHMLDDTLAQVPASKARGRALFGAGGVMGGAGYLAMPEKQAGTFLQNVATILGQAGTGMKSYGTGLLNAGKARYAGGPSASLLDQAMAKTKPLAQRLGVGDLAHQAGLRVQGQQHGDAVGRFLDQLKGHGGPLLQGDTYKPLKDLTAASLAVGVPAGAIGLVDKGLGKGLSSVQDFAGSLRGPTEPQMSPATSQAAVGAMQDQHRQLLNQEAVSNVGKLSRAALQPKQASGESDSGDDIDDTGAGGTAMSRGWQWRAMNREADENLTNWMPRFFTSKHTPLAETLASPAKQSLLKGLVGAMAGGAAGYFGSQHFPEIGINPFMGAGIGAAAGGGLGALHGYGSRRKENDRILDALRHMQPGVTLGEAATYKGAMDKEALNPSTILSALRQRMGQVTAGLTTDVLPLHLATLKNVAGTIMPSFTTRYMTRSIHAGRPRSTVDLHSMVSQHPVTPRAVEKSVLTMGPDSPLRGQPVATGRPLSEATRRVLSTGWHERDALPKGLNPIPKTMTQVPSTVADLQKAGPSAYPMLHDAIEEAGHAPPSWLQKVVGTKVGSVCPVVMTEAPGTAGGCGGVSETDLGPYVNHVTPSHDDLVAEEDERKRQLHNQGKSAFDVDFANFCLEGELLLKQAEGGLAKATKTVGSMLLPTEKAVAKAVTRPATTVAGKTTSLGSGFLLPEVPGVQVAKGIPGGAAHGLEEVGGAVSKAKTMAGGAPQGFAPTTMASSPGLGDRARGVWDRMGGQHAGTTLSTGLGAYGGYLDTDENDSFVKRLGMTGLGAAAGGIGSKNRTANAVGGTLLGGVRGRWMGQGIGGAADLAGGALGYHGSLAGYDDAGNPVYRSLGYGDRLGQLGGLAGAAHGAGKQLVAMGGTGKLQGTRLGKGMEGLGGKIEEFGEGAQRGVRALPEKLYNVGRQSLGFGGPAAPIHEGLGAVGKAGIGVGLGGTLMATHPLTRQNAAATMSADMMPQIAEQSTPYVNAALGAGQQRAQQSMDSFKSQMDKYLTERGIIGPSGRVDPVHSLLRSLGERPELLQNLGQVAGGAMGAYGAYRGNPFLAAGGLGLMGYSNPHVRNWAGNQLQGLTGRMGSGTMGRYNNPLAQEHALTRQEG